MEFKPELKICEKCERYVWGIEGPYCRRQNVWWYKTPMDDDFYVPKDCDFLLEQTLEFDRLMAGDKVHETEPRNM